MHEAEFKHLYEIMKYAKKILYDEYKPKGYNIGVNCGEVAWETIFHFHLYIITIYKNDVNNLSRGIRNIKKPVEYY